METHAALIALDRAVREGDARTRDTLLARLREAWRALGPAARALLADQIAQIESGQAAGEDDLAARVRAIEAADRPVSEAARVLARAREAVAPAPAAMAWRTRRGPWKRRSRSSGSTFSARARARPSRPPWRAATRSR